MNSIVRPAFVILGVALVQVAASAQGFSAHLQPGPIPPGRVIQAKDGDTIVVDHSARLRIVRRTDANIRAIYSQSQHWVVLLADFAGRGGVEPDGAADLTYTFSEVTNDWPLGERWEGSAVIEEYSLAGSGNGSGFGLRMQSGLVQLLLEGGALPDAFEDSAALGCVRYRVVNVGTPGGALSFDAAEPRAVSAAVAFAKRRAAETRPVTPTTSPGPRDVSGNASVSLAPVRVGGNIAVPQKVHDVKPILPAAAAQARITGVVIVELTIATDGTVVNAKVLRSIPLLDQAALDAVRQWRYTPTLINGTAVPVILTATVNFTQ
jgi:TonB family protein